MENIFKEQIDEFANSMLENFEIEFMYMFDEFSNTHMFKILDDELHDGENFQLFLDEEINKLIESKMYHGICFSKKNDNTFSFVGAKRFSSKAEYEYPKLVASSVEKDNDNDFESLDWMVAHTFTRFIYSRTTITKSVSSSYSNYATIPTKIRCNINHTIS